MEGQLMAAEQQVLAEIVKLAQKHRLTGKKGGWKDFLNNYDNRRGGRASDPSKRSKDVLVSFLKTLAPQQNVRELFSRVLQCHQNRSQVKQFAEEPMNNESPVQRLNRLTLEHPLYPVEYSFPSSDQGWVVTKLNQWPKNVTSTALLAIDCEMVLCEDGTDACVKVCVVDHRFEVKLDLLINPDKAVSDYRTTITGISAEDLAGVECTLADVQKTLKNLLSHGAILVGHALSNDLKVLKFDYANIIDTSYIFKNAYNSIHRRPSLSTLCKFVLDHELRKEGAPHNCLDDATAVMKLVLAVIDRGVSMELPNFSNDVPEPKTAKLLLHRIPSSVMIDELKGAIPGNYKMEMKQRKKVTGNMYSAFAIFSCMEEANEAFQELEGTVEKDSLGQTQKVITFLLKSGVRVSLCVRQTFGDWTNNQSSAKKRAGERTMAEEPKKPKKMEIADNRMVATHLCQGYLEEIGRLSEKDLLLRGRSQDHLDDVEETKEALSRKDLEFSARCKKLKKQKKKRKVIRRAKKSKA
ncbi:hypothetical protein MLD38_007318 [Melastoma candidum]|uniref:Uncharacterized protein n=1 Tax=Melastoma candidum TaxID=119954 RepID=A0ACB9RQE6_9MYRT|nr:hypothetical protein MLD38_007318 [Melastoma candidum]